MPRTRNRAAVVCSASATADRQNHADRLHSDAPSAASRAGVGVSTTSTSSSAEKSTAGLISDALVGAAGLLDRLDPADHEPLRVDAVDPRRHHDVADDDVEHLRHVVQPQPVVAAADDHALRAGPLDDRARPRRCDRSAAALSPTRRLGHDQPADDAGRRNHRHVGARRPSRVPLSMVSVRKSGVAAAPMISAATVLSCRCSRSSSSCLEAAGAIGERALLLHRDLGARPARASARRSRP